MSLPDGTQFQRDESGIVRSLRLPPTSSAEMFISLGEAPTTVRQLADNFVAEAGLAFGLDRANLTSVHPPLLSESAADKMQIIFKEEKTGPGLSTVVYEQKVSGVPVWNSGLTVQVLNDRLRVVSSQNQLSYGVVIDQVPGAASSVDAMTPERLAKLLGLSSWPREFKINAKPHIWIYKHKSSERLDPVVHSPSQDMLQEHPPILPLPPLPDNFKDGNYYLVLEVLFTLPLPGWDGLNWRALIDLKTDAVLYLRALVACLRGALFLKDPVLPDGKLVSIDSTDAELAAARNILDLVGLISPGDDHSLQELKSEFVELKEFSSPVVASPTVNPPADFVFDVRTADFAAVSAYHHCDGLFRLVQKMGIDVRTYFSGTTFPVPVDHYGLNGEANARAPCNPTGNGSGGFLFGLARVEQAIGIATCARVVMHEFGHALLWNHVRASSFGFAHSAGDSLAAILYDPDSRLPNRFDTFPFLTASGRDLGRRHDRSIEQGWAWGGLYDDTKYGSEQILSTTMFRIYRSAGGDSADVAVQQAASRYVAYLIIKSIGQLSFTTTNPEVFVEALIDADVSTTEFEGRPGATLQKVIRWSFEQQGLYRSAGAPRPNVGKGQPPRSDVFVDDDRNGEYMPFADGTVSNSGIWNRRVADGGQENQDPVVGADNFLFVRVRNRGFGPAANTRLQIFQQSGQEDVWPHNWKSQGNPISLGTIGSEAESLAGPVAWKAADPSTAILAVVWCDDDPTLLEIVPANTRISQLAALDNNLGYREFAAQIA